MIQQIPFSCMLASGWPDGITRIPCSPAGAQECKIPCVTNKIPYLLQLKLCTSALPHFFSLRSLQQWNIQNLPLPLIQYLPTSSQKKHLPSLAPAASAGCVLGAQQAYNWQKGKEIEERKRQQFVPPVLRRGRSVLQQKFLPEVNFFLKNSEKNPHIIFSRASKKKENLYRTRHSFV